MLKLVTGLHDSAVGSLFSIVYDRNLLRRESDAKRRTRRRNLGLVQSIGIIDVVCQLIELYPFGKLDTLWLSAAGTLGKFIHKADDGRPLGWVQMLGTVLLQFLQCWPRTTFPHHEGHSNGFLQSIVRCSEAQGLENIRMLHQALLDLKRTDNFAASVDNFLASAGNVQVIIGVDPSEIARVEPPAGKEGLGVGLIISFVPIKARGSSNADVANTSLWDLCAIVLQNLDFWSDRTS